MNAIKYKLTFFTVAALLSWVAVSPVLAQDYKGRINVKPELVLEGDSLHLYMTVTLEGVSIDSERALTLTPVLTGEGQTQSLAPLIINGSRRHQLYRRYQSLNRKRMEKAGADYPLAVKSEKNPPLSYEKEILYHTAVAFEEWMRNSSLDMVQDLCGCAGYTQEISVERLAAIIQLKDTKSSPMMAYIRPAVETVKMRDEQADAFLDFKVGEITILPDFGTNRKELDKAESILRELLEDKNVNVTSIRIRGYASPEGEEKLNNRLGVGRANALSQYLSRRISLPMEICSVEPVGEDWKGFERLMEESTLFDGKYRADVLAIIRSVAANDAKDASIKALKTGSYDMILKNIYSKLRRVTCVVDYRVKAFNLEEAKETYSRKPQQLSLDELFRVANTFDDSDPQFGEVFETAVRMFPEDPTANLNAAASSLLFGNTERAKRYLERSDPSTGEYMNNMGVYEMLNGNHKTAREWFEKAREQGVRQAKHNLAELEKQKVPQQ